MSALDKHRMKESPPLKSKGNDFGKEQEEDCNDSHDTDAVGEEEGMIDEEQGTEQGDTARVKDDASEKTRQLPPTKKADFSLDIITPNDNGEEEEENDDDICVVCGLGTDATTMLLCDECNKG